MKPAREQTCSPLLVDSRRKKQTVVIDRSSFLSEPSRFAPVIVAHKDSALPWLVDDRAAPSTLAEFVGYSPDSLIERVTVWLRVLQRPVRLSATVLPASRGVTTFRRAPNWSSEGTHRVEHHPHTTRLSPRVNRPAGSRRQSGGAISWARVSTILYPPEERPSHTYTSKQGFGGRVHDRARIEESSRSTCLLCQHY